MNDNISNIKEDQKRRDIGRDLSYLSGLLNGINYEDVTFKDLKKKMKSHSYKGSILIQCDKIIYRHASIIALTNQFTRNDKYKILPLDILVDIWFSNDEQKKDLLKYNVIILQSNKAVQRSVGPLRRVLIEVLEARRGLNLNTWLFLNEVDVKSFYSEDILNHVDKFYDYNEKE